MPQDANSHSEDAEVSSEVDYAALVHLHHRDLFSFVRRYVSATDADDIVQDTFLAVIAKGLLPERLVSARAFLFGVARNMIRRHRRSIGYQPVYLDKLPEVSATPESSFQTAEHFQLLLRALDASCNPVEREVIMHAVGGESDDAIAQAAGLSNVHVRVLKHRAIRKLKKYLEEDGHSRG